MTIRWQEITTVNHPKWTQALDLYDATFPLEVREPHHVFSRSLQRKGELQPSDFHFLIGLAKRSDEQAEQVAAMAVLHYLAEVNWGFLVYLLVAPNLRGQGLGYALHAQVEQFLQADANASGHNSLRGIVLETEIEEQMHEAEEIEASHRRTHFFQQCGYRPLVNTRYLQPPLHPNSAPVPLRLFVKLCSEPHALTTSELRHVVQAVYREKYGQMNQISPDILQACEKHFAHEPRS